MCKRYGQKGIPVPVYLHWMDAEFANSVWCPYKIGDLKEIEKIQKKATKLVMKLKNKSHTDRCLWGDVIQIFKITHNIRYNGIT